MPPNAQVQEFLAVDLESWTRELEQIKPELEKSFSLWSEAQTAALHVTSALETQKQKLRSDG